VPAGTRIRHHGSLGVRSSLVRLPARRAVPDNRSRSDARRPHLRIPSAMSVTPTTHPRVAARAQKRVDVAARDAGRASPSSSCSKRKTPCQALNLGARARQAARRGGPR
jgi:hypothetical protein